MSCREEKQAAQVANACHIVFPEMESIVLTVSPLQHHHYPRALGHFYLSIAYLPNNDSNNVRA